MATKKAKPKPKVIEGDFRPTGIKCPHCGKTIKLDLVYAPKPGTRAAKPSVAAAQPPEQIVVALFLPCQGGTVRRYCPVCLQWYCVLPDATKCPKNHTFPIQ